MINRFRTKMDNGWLTRRRLMREKFRSSAASRGGGVTWIKCIGCAAQFAYEQKLPGFTRP
jgi:hypothetical protein